MSPPPQKRQRRNAIRPNSNEYVSLAEFGATLALQRMGVSTAEAAENEVSNNEAKESASGSEADGDEKPEDGGEEGEAGPEEAGVVASVDDAGDGIDEDTISINGAVSDDDRSDSEGEEEGEDDKQNGAPEQV